jgi:hypothetical protein
MLTLQEVSGLTELSASTLKLWVKKGFVRPARPGGRGRGNGHRFSYCQTLGLAFVSYFQEEIPGYLGPAYVADILMKALGPMQDRITDRELAARITDKPDAWDKEIVAKMSAALGPVSDQPFPAEWQRRTDRVVNEIRRRMGFLVDRSGAGRQHQSDARRRGSK